MDFAGIWEKYHDKLTFHGTIGTQTVMPFGTPDEVRRRGGNAPTMEEAFIRIVEESREKRRRADAGEAAS